MAPTKRGFITALYDMYAGWKGGLPWETCSYTVDTLRIPMADGIHLASDFYQPIHPKPLGTILVQTPYGRDVSISMNTAHLWAARGYQVLITSARGSFGSEGSFQPMRDDLSDGRSTVEWMRKQQWYTGTFATLGASYLGFTQWCLLAWPEGPPADMKAAIINTGPHSFERLIFGPGAFSLTFIFWARFLRLMHSGVGMVGRLRGMMALKQKAETEVYDAVPILPAVEKYLDGDTPDWVYDGLKRIERPERGRAFQLALEQERVPIMQTTGWYDFVKDHIFEQHEALKKRGIKTSLIIGPWTHLEAGGRNSLPDTLAWLEEHLTGQQPAKPTAPVRAYITGANEWRDMTEWPPASNPQELFLLPDNKLGETKPWSGASESSTFMFDPANSPPPIGCPTQFGLSPSPDDTALYNHPDVLSFTTEPLPSDLEVCGKPFVELHHETDSPHADLFLRISEVDQSGKSRNITETYMRLDPKRESGPLQIEIADCGHRFRKGVRIRLAMGGGLHPRYLRNFGSGEEPGSETTLSTVTHTVFCGEGRVSKLVLPVH